MNESNGSASIVDNLRKEIDAELGGLITKGQPAELYDAARYVMSGGGKRVRPILLLLAARMFGESQQTAMPAALAVEIFHNFTLVHDDIMDRSGERRGRPTVHARWNDAVAILVGDYLMSVAYTQLARTEVKDLSRLTTTFGEMVRSLCEGQILDMSFEERTDVAVTEYLDMIDAKTAALLRASLVLGGQVGAAAEADLALLRDLGTHIGLAFQIQDDLLDLTAEDVRWGKPVGGDLIQGKKTYLVLRAVERERERGGDWFSNVLAHGGLHPENVPEARRRLDLLGVLGDAASAVRLHTDTAIQKLRQLPDSDVRAILLALVERIGSRVH